jgi:predicted enzyme related to lactoylglutathione lyase
MKFSGILIGSENAPALAEYYTRLLGEPMMNEGGYTSWAIGDGGMTVGPHSEVHGKNAEPGRMIWNIESDDVAGDFAKLRDAGAIVVREPYEMEGMSGTWIATMADPDDNYFQLISPFEASRIGD